MTTMKLIHSVIKPNSNKLIYVMLLLATIEHGSLARHHDTPGILHQKNLLISDGFPSERLDRLFNIVDHDSGILVEEKVLGNIGIDTNSSSSILKESTGGKVIGLKDMLPFGRSSPEPSTQLGHGATWNPPKTTTARPTYDQIPRPILLEEFLAGTGPTIKAHTPKLVAETPV